MALNVNSGPVYFPYCSGEDWEYEYLNDIKGLPVTVLRQIIEMLNVNDILNLSETCSFFNMIINYEKGLWRSLILMHYGQEVTAKLTRPKFLYRLIYRTWIARYIPFYHECDVTYCSSR